MSSKVVTLGYTDKSQEQTQIDVGKNNEDTVTDRTPLLEDSRQSIGGAIVLALICAIFLIGLICGIYLILKEDGNLDSSALNIVTREHWGASETNLSNNYLVLPLEDANNYGSKSDSMVNFMVGGDGGIYEGCGWNCKSVSSTDNNTLTFGLLGTFQDRPPTEFQVFEMIALVNYAVSEKKLLQCFTVTVKENNEITFLAAVAAVLRKHAMCN